MPLFQVILDSLIKTGEVYPGTLTPLSLGPMALFIYLRYVVTLAKQ